MIEEISSGGSKMGKKVLLLDIDEVFCFSGFLKFINEFLSTSYVIDDFTDYYIDEAAIPKERFAEFNQFIQDKNLYLDAYILPYAVEVIKKLNEIYDVYPCTDCLNPFNIEKSGIIYKNKFDFLLEKLPFINPKHFIFTAAKGVIKADVIIDDRLSNLKNDIPTRILFPSYHNKDITDHELIEKGILRAGMDWREGWINVADILIEDKDFVKNLKRSA